LVYELNHLKGKSKKTLSFFKIKERQMKDKINVFGIIIMIIILIDFFGLNFLNKYLKGFLYLIMFLVFAYKVYLSYLKNN
jgi:hypothetical protein